MLKWPITAINREKRLQLSKQVSWESVLNNKPRGFLVVLRPNQVIHGQLKEIRLCGDHLEISLTGARTKNSKGQYLPIELEPLIVPFTNPVYRDGDQISFNFQGGGAACVVPKEYVDRLITS